LHTWGLERQVPKREDRMVQEWKTNV
jgi:hypothetical protein